MIKNQFLLKYETSNIGPYEIAQIQINGIITKQMGAMVVRYNKIIIKPYKNPWCWRCLLVNIFYINLHIYICIFACSEKGIRIELIIRTLTDIIFFYPGFFIWQITFIKITAPHIISVIIHPREYLKHTHRRLFLSLFMGGGVTIQ